MEKYVQNYMDDYIDDYSYDKYIREFYNCENIEEETELQMEGINCSEEFMMYLKQNVKILDLYCSLALDKYNILELPEKTVRISQKKVVNNDSGEIHYEPRLELPNVKMYGGYRFHFSSCLFHNGGSGTTFSINDRLNCYYCCGCGSKGNIFHFVCNVFDVGLLEATMIIAEIANLTIPDDEKPPFFDEQFLLLQPKALILPQVYPLLRGTIEANGAHSLRQKATKKRQDLLNRIDRYILNQYKLGLIDETVLTNDNKIWKMCDRLCIDYYTKLVNQRITIFFTSEEYKNLCDNIKKYIVTLIKNNDINEYIFYDEEKMLILSKKVGIGKSLFERNLGKFYEYRYKIFIDEKISNIIESNKLNSKTSTNEIRKVANSCGIDFLILKERLHHEKVKIMSIPGCLDY